MELTIKIKEEIMQQAMENAIKNVETEMGMTIKECIDKQKERIPVYHIDTELYTCPVCKRIVNHNYCGSCGQKIYWN